tara:strand:+ start:57 stop:668 length:612 start_codon:yes stop_codon:yes gene_type:complete
MKSITKIIALSFVLLILGCQENNCPIYNGGHLGGSKRELLPEPDIALRLQSEYFELSNKMVRNKLKKENYIANKKFEKSTSETDVVVGRNESNQVVVLEEYIFNRYVDKTYEIIQTYFLDSFGKVFAIEQHTNSICQEDDAHQIIVRYYNSDFKLIKTTFEIKGSGGEDLDKKICGSEFDEDLGIESNYNSILDSYEQVKEKI